MPGVRGRKKLHTKDNVLYANEPKGESSSANQRQKAGKKKRESGREKEQIIKGHEGGVAISEDEAERSSVEKESRGDVECLGHSDCAQVD
jgi:hypothetical protein